MVAIVFTRFKRPVRGCCMGRCVSAECVIWVNAVGPRFSQKVGVPPFAPANAPANHTSAGIKLGAGGKPSTWLPPGRLVEHNQQHGGPAEPLVENKTQHNRATNIMESIR